ncbi:DNA repair exonuclease SbcCD ATPase subunit [Mesorhizobium soli]|uniref:hypothetical protein n=1 Tax=Pseudaminobacter soli (ex Li et al. 2025) TaxID=1295366 RepID=UPI00247669BD|nr:hypothetical protein [Mesorhizobium soli]MDH6234911.1 DNA repair exonuclease SbcCD ATPase subunit [Mesorhizobium soli]
MIQSILFFALGFLVAGFIALLVAPAVLRRAANLARRRVEASMPLTRAEIEADKDRIRAEAAMSIRKLEVNASALREKATTQLIDISRGLEQIKALGADGDAKAKTIAMLEAQVGTLSADLARCEEELQRVSERLEETEGAKAVHAKEMEKLGAMYDEASFSASSRQIELVARESELEKLANEVTQLKSKRKDADARAQALSLEARAVRDETKAERKRANEAERKLAQATSKLADREDLIERRNAEIERLRGAPVAQAERSGPITSAPKVVAAQASIDEALAKLSADRERLEERLTALARENKRLKEKAAAGGPAANGGDAQLREQMNELAAEVVNLAAMLDGPNSPIHKVLAEMGVDGEHAGKALSLADRIRALQKASSTD